MSKLGAIRKFVTIGLVAAHFTALASLGYAAANNSSAHSFDLSEHLAAEYIDEATPAAASNEGNCLVVWKDNRARPEPYHRGQYLLYGRRFDLNGKAIDATSFQVQDEPFVWNNEGLTLPTVGTLDREYLVVWLTRFRHFAARRIRSDGTVNSNEISIANITSGSGQPALASTRRGCLVAWTSRTDNNGDIYATLLNRDGEVTGVVPIAVGAPNAQYPVVASAGKDYLVLWRELSASGEGVMKAARVTQGGEVQPLDQFPVALADWITVASNGRNYFVAWQHCSGPGAPSQLSGSILNGRGKVIKEGLPIAECGPELSLPAVLLHGRNFTIAWRENPYSTEAQLYALTLSARGLAKNLAAPVASDSGWSGYGSATAIGKTNVLVTLEQKTPDYDQNGYVSRVRGIVVAGRQ